MKPSEQKQLARTREIKLRTGEISTVDADLYEELNQFKWSCLDGYAVRFDSEERKTVRLHRVVNQTPGGVETDHINGNRLDNRKSNLRNATRSQNTQNRKTGKGKSKFIGVSWHGQKKKWRSTIMVNYKQISLGLFSEETEAAQAYNNAALKHYGEHAKLNQLQPSGRQSNKPEKWRSDG